MKEVLFGMSFLACVQLLSAQSSNRDDFTISISRTSEPITVDGLLEEEVWNAAEWAGGFWQNAPIDQKPASQETRVRITYDDKNIYLAAMMKASRNYVIQSLKRDGALDESDAFAVIFDPLGQKTLGYTFGINAGGAQTEALVSAAQGFFVESVDPSWDARWYSAVQETPDGWVVEMAIPFKSIRYKEGLGQWGINFWRSDRQSNELQVWARVPVQFLPTDLGFCGSLRWDAAPQVANRNISITPYVLGSYEDDQEDSDRSVGDFSVGGEAKIGLSPTLNVDLTLNPDFSQTDVDQQVTNLTRFSIFFPERRQFFLENADIFTNFGAFPDAPFFSRRIGLDVRGNKVPITYGARLSGNLDANWRIGILNAQTRNQDALPAQNYTAAALHRKVFKRSTIRGLFVNRQEVGEDDYGRNGTLEFEYLSNDGRWRGKAGYNQAFKEDRDQQNQFLVGNIGYNGRQFQASWEFQKMGDNYSADLGFVSRLDNYDPVANAIVPIGYTYSATNLDYSWYPQNKRVVRHWVGLENYVWWVRNGLLNESYTRLRYFLFFQNTSQLRFRINHNFVHLLYPFQITGETPLPVGKYNFSEYNIQFNTDLRRRFNLEMFLVHGAFYTGTKSTVRTTINYRTQPWGNFALGLEMNDIRLGADYGNTQLWLINPQLVVNFSNNLFWTTFIQFNTQADNLNINSRLQWRYRAMSDLFLVYTDNYQTENGFGPKSRAIVLKFNYYFQL